MRKRRIDPQASGLGVLLTCRPLLILAACAALFHFANAPMLHLVGQKLALANAGLETPFMSGLRHRRAARDGADVASGGGQGR